MLPASMAPLQVFGMKMRNLLFGVILRLLAVVHSTPVNTVTQIPTKAEDNVFRDAMTDGFLIDHFFIPLLTTESPKSDQASQQSSSDFQSSGTIEGSAEGEISVKSITSLFLQYGGEHHNTTTIESSHAQSSISTLLPRDSDNSGSDSSTTQSHQSSFISSSLLNEAQSSVTLNHSVSQTTAPDVSIFDFLSTQSSDLGGEMMSQSTSTSSSMTSSSESETSTASSTFTAPSEGSSSGSGIEGSGTQMSKNISVTTVSVGSKGLGAGSKLRLAMPKERVENVSTVFGSREGPGSEIESESGSEMSQEPVEKEERVSTVFAAHEGPGSESGSEISQEMSVSTFNEKKNTNPSINEQKEMEPNNPPSARNKGHSTQGWIIILGFIVGVAVLVMLCVAIATRDKWNGPNQTFQQETKTNSSNQQRETLLHKDNPRENGKMAGYTIIPLDELPEKCLSQ